MLKLCLLLLCFTAAFAAKPNCEKLAKNAETCLKSTIFMIDFKTPKTTEEFNSYNEEYGKAIKCMKQYRPCLKGLSRQTYGLIVGGVTKFGKYMFGKGSNATGVLFAIKCINSKALKSMHEALETFSARMIYTSKTATSFNELCCGLRLMEDAVMGSVDKEKCKDSIKEAEDFVKHMLLAFTEDASVLLCSKHSSRKICENEFPSTMTALRSVDVSKHGTDQFVFRPLLQMLTKLTQ